MTGRRRMQCGSLVVTAIVLAGCGTASTPYAPTGVDGLVIPTPSVDPRDFVTGIDNPWLPLRPGAAWTYDVTGQAITLGVGTMTVTVEPGTTAIDGIAASAVRTVLTGTAVDDTPVPDTTTDYYAQDTSGNVWWLGRAGVWQAGEDGAEAGLAMPAHPRLGDGWREGYAPGVVEDRAQISDLGDAFSVDGRRYTGVLDLEVSSDLSPGIVRERSYARGVGLVRSFAEDGPAELIELVSGP